MRVEVCCVRGVGVDVGGCVGGFFFAGGGEYHGRVVWVCGFETVD